MQREPKVYIGLSLIGAAPQGEFSERVDDALGGQLDVTVPVAEDGRIRVPQGPGLGCDPDPAIVAKYRV